MKVSLQPRGRENQKQRTRQAIVDAAIELLAEGVVPTVPGAAERARVSRATAYRYFPSKDSLLFEAGAVTPIFKVVLERASSLQNHDPEDRLCRFVELANEAVFANETIMRTALRTYHDQWLEQREQDDQERPVLRQGRRLELLDQALAPLKDSLPNSKWRKLRSALSLTVGAEAMSVMKDVCQLNEDAEAMEVLRWVALTLLRACLAETDEASLAGEGERRIDNQSHRTVDEEGCTESN